MTRWTARLVLAGVGSLLLFFAWYPSADPRIVVWWFSASDFSWTYAFNRAAALGARHGSEVLSMWGPLAHLVQPLDVGPHIAQSLLLKLTVNLVLATLVWWLLIRIGTPGLALAFYGSLAIATGLLAGALLEYQLPFLLLVALFLGVDTRSRVLLGALSAAVAVAALLMKATMGFACLALVAVYCGLRGRERPGRARIAAWAGASAAASLVLLFLATGNRLRDLAAFLRTSLEMSRGYASAYTLDGPLAEAALAAAVPITVAGLGCFASAPTLRRAAGLSLPVLILAFWHGFRRHDVYHMLLALGVFWAVGALLIAAFALAPGRTARDRVALGVTVGMIAAAWLGIAGLRRAEPYVWQWILLARPARVLADHVPPRAYPAVIRANQADALRSFVLPDAVRRVVRGHPVDIVPRDAAYAHANALQWRPRPVFPSDNVTTAHLDDLNAAYIGGPVAPRFLLYEFKSIDHRHPSFDEPRTWREIACRYAPRLRAGPWLVLERSDGRACPTSVGAPGAPLALPWEEALRLEQDQSGLVIHVDVRPSAAGVVSALLFRPALSFIDVEYTDGVRIRHRLVEATARNGLLVGNLPRTLGEVHDLLRGAPVQSVASIRFVTRARWAYTDRVGVRLTRADGKH